MPEKTDRLDLERTNNLQESMELDSVWCKKCDGKNCGNLTTHKCPCGHYKRDHTFVRPANAKPKAPPAGGTSSPSPVAGGQPKMIFCSECGLKAAGGKFCAGCGAKFDGPTPAAAPAPAPTPTPTPVAQKAYSKPNSTGLTTSAGANHGQAFGLTAESNAKVASKYDSGLEAQVVSWITKKTGTSKEGSLSLGDWLHNGEVLCHLANAITPGSIKKIGTSKMAFKQMENISAFLKVCENSFGITTFDLFQTVDLYEEKNMVQVLMTLATVKRLFQ